MVIVVVVVVVLATVVEVVDVELDVVEEVVVDEGRGGVEVVVDEVVVLGGVDVVVDEVVVLGGVDVVVDEGRGGVDVVVDEGRGGVEVVVDVVVALGGVDVLVLGGTDVVDEVLGLGATKIGGAEVVVVEVGPVAAVPAVVVGDGDVKVVVGAAGATRPAISTATRLVVAVPPWRATRVNTTERGLGVALAAITARAEMCSLEQSLQAPEYPTENGWLDTTSSRHDEASSSAPEIWTSPPKRLREAGSARTHRMAGRDGGAAGPPRSLCMGERDGWAVAVAVAATATDRRATTA